MSDIIASARNMSVVAEGQLNTVGQPYGSLTPSTLTAMVGMSQGGALQISPKVTQAISALQSKAAQLAASGGANAAILSAAGVSFAAPLPDAAAITSAINNINTAAASFGTSVNTSGLSDYMSVATRLNNHSQSLFGSPTKFGQLAQMAHGHCMEAIEINQATNFMSSTSFEKFGTGISSMSSMATRGLDKVMGSLPSAGTIMASAGKVFDLKNPAGLGAGSGLIDKLSSVKLGNFSGVNDALVKNGVDLNRLTDPVYSSQITKTLQSVTDPNTINTVKSQLGVTGNFTNLNDLTDMKKLVPGPASASVSTDLIGMGSKLTEMGASFKNPKAASDMLNNIQIPNVPKLDAFAPSLSSLTSKLAPDISSMIKGNELCSGPAGLPNMRDFVEGAAGGPSIDALLANVGPSQIAAVDSMITRSQNLMSKAGIDPTSFKDSFTATKAFATGLHKMGADVSGLGIQDVLGDMATDDTFGQAIKASLAEGKNKALMLANGISPLNFNPNPPNLFSGLPSASGINSLGSGATILGG